MGLVRRFLEDNSGLSMTEYVLGAALVAMFLGYAGYNIMNNTRSTGTFSVTRTNGCIPNSTTWTASCP